MIDSGKSSGRILYIDFLKFLGLSCIILAHVSPPSWLFMLRNFDVPLMVIISSILGQKSYEKYQQSNTSAINFCISRGKRLAFPAWIFLSGLFFILFISGIVYNVEYYIYSFLFTRYGISYVWIILIYIYSACLIPIYSKMRNFPKSWAYVIIIYLFYELFLSLNIYQENKLIDSTICYIIPYGLLTYLGFSYQRFNKKTKATILIISALVFLTVGVFYWKKSGNFQDVQIAKYPPRAYYLSYGILMTFFLLSICEKLQIKLYPLYTNKFILFTSQNSMWIYLWHIFALMLYKKLYFPQIWYIKFVIVYFISVVIVMFVNRLLDVICKYFNWSFLRYLRG